MHILFVSRWFPIPPDVGAKRRILALLQALAARHTLDLVAFTAGTVGPDELQALRPYCARVYPVTYRPFQPGRLRALLGFLSPQPRSVVDTFNVAMQSAVQLAWREHPPQCVIGFEIDMAPYLVRTPRSPRILEALELVRIHDAYAQAASPLRRARAGLTWWKLTRYVRRLLTHIDRCTVVSEGEQQLAQALSARPGQVCLVPNGVDLQHNRPGLCPPLPDTLIYTGALTYDANFDAVAYFLRDIFPLIAARRPQVRLVVTGSQTGVNLDRLPHCDRVTFTGYLDDVRPAVAGAWVSVVPLRLGAGTRVKILESLALGTPVVTTPKGVEGLDLRPSRDVLVAGTPADFATEVIRVLAQPDLRACLSRNGRRAVEVHYDWACLGAQYCDLVEETAACYSINQSPVALAV